MSKKLTLREQLVVGLTNLGYHPVSSRSGKYLAYEGGTLKNGNKLFVGRSGALRIGKNASKSFSLTDRPFYQKVLSAAKENDNV